MNREPDGANGTDEGDATREAPADRAARVVSTAAHDIGGFIRSQRESAQVSLRQLAQLAGVSNPYLSQIERGLRKPSAEVLGQIAKGLRVSSEVLYIQAGYLEQRELSPVRDAVLADGDLTDRQKQALLEIYDSFRRENDTADESNSESSTTGTTSTTGIVSDDAPDAAEPKPGAGSDADRVLSSERTKENR
ncbi:XRE family transcriptional regulator [Rhodococcus rhodnii]|uniref:XRE family transcriptional regulator n=1 Tax=Rhodococcus rhodnii TaxID=38312 RepID=A0A6P2CJF9_9NOCA|nr:XRE family transcriptional regulator [Rhodococcus rhodnii]